MSSGSPELFVVCKSCGSEVSPYITECPYCGQRLRKRAPKIERDEIGDAKEPKAPRSARRRLPPEPPKIPKPRRAPRRTRRSSDAFRGDEFRRPTVTITLVALSAIGAIVLAVLGRTDTALIGPPDGEWWRVASTVFLYGNGWYQFAAVLAIGLFGWRLEARHGPALVVALFVACGVGGTAIAAVAESFPIALGGIGAGLGLLAAYAVPVLRARRRSGDDDDDVDLLGTFVIGAVLALMPIATPDANAVAAAAGLVLGGITGLMLDRVAPRDD
ncbi:rhomboid family intramembrane serine protease [Paraconexibacter sp.]|uniref:rhomboid family intramembrane serine protease n=1 Tax=Paraconexibacter sp. TaxID=2949640 RepID=UPI0035688594